MAPISHSNRSNEHLEGLASAYDVNDMHAIEGRLRHSRDIIEQLSGVVHEGFARPPEKVTVFNDAETGAIAVLVIDDTIFGRTAGGMQLRSFSEGKYLGDVTKNIDRLEAMATYSARCGSWKCWLGGIPLSGGKLIVVAPDEIATSPDHLSVREALLARVGDAFRRLPYWAKPDVGMTPQLLEAYRNGGGKVSGTRIRDKSGLALYTASSVIGGLEAGLAYRTGKTLDQATVVLVGAAGRIGQQLLTLFYESGAHLILVDRNGQKIRELGSQFGVPVVNKNESLELDADIFCASGPPGQFTEKKVRMVKAKVCGGPANDLLAHPDLYRLRDDVTFLPGATLTAASMYVPHAYRSLSSTDIREASHNIIQAVLRLRDLSSGTLTTFEAMVAEAEMMGMLSRRAWSKATFDAPDKE